MNNAGLTLPFIPPETASSGETLLLKQEEWAKSTGLLTRANAIAFIGSRTYTNTGSSALSWPVMDCGLTDGRLVIKVHVYPPRGVAFRFLASIGEISGPNREDVEEESTQHFTLTTEASLSYPASRITSTQWLTGPWNAEGVKIAPPPLTVNGRTLSVLGDVVYGSVQVKTLVSRWTYELTVAWAEAVESLNAGWGEYAVAFPDGGEPVALELTEPPGAAEMAASGAECGLSYRVKKKKGKENWPPKAQPADKYVDCDYCKLECDDGYKP